MISCLLVLFSTTVGIAQTIAPDSLKAQLIKDWERAKAYTAEYLAAMPADKYTAKPVEGIRSFSEQMLHLAQGSIGLSANGTGKTRIFPGYNMEKSATAQTKDSVSYYVNASYDFAIEGIKAMDANKLGELVKRGNFNESRLTWIMKGFEHQTHHRGQCTIYIRLQGVTPPNEKLF
ncbi:MAG: damage-inducible protein DinB [Chitinophagaceae bacterium]|nr:damage-inducible protein DinB [Chitinophagaceae bacterium]